MTEQQPINTINERDIRCQKLEQLVASGETPYKYSYDRTAYIADVLQKFAHFKNEEESPDTYKLVGRIVARRGHGKASFGNIQDQTGKIQYFAKVDILGEATYNNFLNLLDVGDFIGIEGKIFRTLRGELSIKVEKYEFLSKALLPLPEKWHGLQDKETRYRQRYLDLIANPDVKDVFWKRSKIIHQIRQFLDKENFIEVETPVLQTIPGGAAARPFKTFHNALAMDLYLRISLELPLKRLIVGGFERVYEIGRVFRNEGISFKHNPEYTLLELYQAYTDYHGMMDLTERLISGVAKAITGGYVVKYGDGEIDFTPPWPRVQYNEINADEFEKKTMNPTFIIDFPVENSPLAKNHRQKKGMVERFEMICGRMEMANAYSELNDPIDQNERFNEQVRQRASGNEEANMKDTDYITALEHGMPPTGGLGIGIDRLVMVLTGQESIRDVILFPHMRELEQK
jgi:lysyl-tRNA synthetase class 2